MFEVKPLVVEVVANAVDMLDRQNGLIKIYKKQEEYQLMWMK